MIPTSPSFRRQATVTASTKRLPEIVSGKRGSAVTKIVSLKCTPLDPVDPELRQRLQIDTPHEVLQTFIDGSLDVKEGDLLVVAGKEYPVRSAADWAWRTWAYRHLIVEDLRI